MYIIRHIRMSWPLSVCRGAWGGGGVAVITWCWTTQGQHVPSMGERTGGVKWHRHASFTSLQHGDNRSLVQIQSIVLGLKMGTQQDFELQIRWAQFELIKISQNCLIIFKTALSIVDVSSLGNSVIKSAAPSRAALSETLLAVVIC